MELIAGIIIGVTFLSIGYFIGNFYPLLKDEKPVEETEEELSAQAKEVTAAIEDGTSIPIEPEPAVPPRQNLVDPLRFWRTFQTKKLMVEFEESLVPFRGELDEVEHGKLAMILVDLQDWIGLQHRLEMENQETPSIELEEEKTPDPVKVSFNPLKLIRAAVATDGKLPSKNKLISIVEQIDVELQKLLPDTEYAKRSVMLVEGPDKEIQVKVGMETFQGIDEVPDEGIRKIIRRAISQWEN